MTAQLPSTEYTLEDLHEIAYRGSYDDMQRSLARALLAAYEQEPVAWTSQRSLDVRDKITAFTSEENAIDYGKSAAWENIVALYTHPAPSIPAVPDEIVGWVRDENGDSRDPLFLCGSVKPGMGKAYNSQYFPVKRAAMLNGGKS
ncbi:hypothetical protein [Phytobacter diazotrophicus]|uniref:hypothetical protein n=1 Tax=Phytobacter diazotrophicus TaxID=395631 RepID=UPI002FF569B6